MCRRRWTLESVSTISCDSRFRQTGSGPSSRRSPSRWPARQNRRHSGRTSATCLAQKLRKRRHSSFRSFHLSRKKGSGERRSAARSGGVATTFTTLGEGSGAASSYYSSKGRHRDAGGTCESGRSPDHHGGIDQRLIPRRSPRCRRRASAATFRQADVRSGLIGHRGRSRPSPPSAHGGDPLVIGCATNHLGNQLGLQGALIDVLRHRAP